MHSKGLRIALFITALVLSCETSEIEEQLETCVRFELSFDHGHNSSAEYIGDLMRRLNDIEAEMRVIKQSIATLDNNTLQTGYKMGNRMSTIDNRMSTIDNRMSAIDNRMSAIDNRMSTIDNKSIDLDNGISVINNTMSAMNGSLNENNVSAICNMSNMEAMHWQTLRKRLAACTDITKDINLDTVTKCMTTQLGVRNGRNASVYTWVIEDYMNKVASPDRDVYSQPFYHKVPGYKFRLSGRIYLSSDIYIFPQLLPGEYDDQLTWPFSRRHDVTVLTSDGLEVQHMSFSDEHLQCQRDRPTHPTDFFCNTLGPNWYYISTNKKHILSDGSIVVKLYSYTDDYTSVPKV